MKSYLTPLAVLALFAMNNATASDLESAVYGKMPDGREVRIFTLSNPNGLTAKVT